MGTHGHREGKITHQGQLRGGAKGETAEGKEGGEGERGEKCKIQMMEGMDVANHFAVYVRTYATLHDLHMYLRT